MEITSNKFKSYNKPKKNTIVSYKNKNSYRKMQLSHRKTVFFYGNSDFSYENYVFLKFSEVFKIIHFNFHLPFGPEIDSTFGPIGKLYFLRKHRF